MANHTAQQRVELPQGVFSDTDISRFPAKFNAYPDGDVTPECCCKGYREWRGGILPLDP
jgi:hypothetical protein